MEELNNKISEIRDSKEATEDDLEQTQIQIDEIS